MLSSIVLRLTGWIYTLLRYHFCFMIIITIFTRFSFSRVSAPYLLLLQTTPMQFPRSPFLSRFLRFLCSIKIQKYLPLASFFSRAAFSHVFQLLGFPYNFVSFSNSAWLPNSKLKRHFDLCLFIACVSFC